MTNATRPDTTRFWPLYGAAVGLAVGLLDTALLYVLGVTMTAGSRDVMIPVSLLFTGGYGTFGYVVGRLLVARRQLREDSTTIVSQYEQLQAQDRQLAEAEKLASLGRMAAGVAHEVRNPLGVIRSSAMLLRETAAGSANPDTDKLCAFMVEEVDRLDAYIGAILDFARPLSVKQVAIELREVVDRAVALAAIHVEQRAVTVVGEAQAHGDADVLVAVVLGLLVNAAEATSADGLVTVSVQKAGNAGILRISDDGDGMTEDVARKVFEPFFTTKARGTGLGLAMAARVAQAHNGELSWDGAGLKGRGATFTLTLPAEQRRPVRQQPARSVA